MALSDRVALLCEGMVEQIAEPREIYGRPATTYVAQFIGQTNILRAEIQGGMAHAGLIAWPSSEAPGNAAFSLRPECIRIASLVAPQDSTSEPVVRFKAKIANQTYGGAMDLLEIDCGDSHVLRARIASPGPLAGEIHFEFSCSDAVRVRETKDK
jgi:ABC-type Fe3+/spermidine/putrescine transport system ATPase subunit